MRMPEKRVDSSKCTRDFIGRDIFRLSTLVQQNRDIIKVLTFPFGRHVYIRLQKNSRCVREKMRVDRIASRRVREFLFDAKFVYRGPPTDGI